MILRLENGNVILDDDDGTKKIRKAKKNKSIKDIFFIDELPSEPLTGIENILDYISYNYGDLVSFKYNEKDHIILFETRFKKKIYQYKINIYKEIYENQDYINQIRDFDKEFAEFNKSLTDEIHSKFTDMAVNLIKRNIILDQYDFSFEFNKDELNKNFLNFLRFRKNELIQNKVLKSMQNKDLFKLLSSILETVLFFILSFNLISNAVLLEAFTVGFCIIILREKMPFSRYNHIDFDNDNRIIFINSLINELNAKINQKEKIKDNNLEFIEKNQKSNIDRVLEFISRDNEIIERFKLFINMDEEKESLYNFEHEFIEQKNYGVFENQESLDYRYKTLVILNKIEERILLKTLPYRIDTDAPLMNEDVLYERLIWLGVDDYVIESNSNIRLLIELISEALKKSNSDEIVNHLFEDLLKLCYISLKEFDKKIVSNSKESENRLNLLPINKD